MSNDMWSQIKQEAEQYQIHPRASVWQRLRRRLDKAPTHRQRLHALRLWAVAASITVLAAIAAWQLYQATRPKDTPAVHLAHRPLEMEMLNRQDTDAVARMAMDFTRYLEKHHPEMLH